MHQSFYKKDLGFGAVVYLLMIPGGLLIAGWGGQSLVGIAGFIMIVVGIVGMIIRIVNR